MTDAALLEEKRESVIVALQVHDSTLGLAWLNLAAGKFCVMETVPDNLAGELERLKPAEVLIPDSPESLGGLDGDSVFRKTCLKRLPFWHFDVEAAARILSRQLGTHDLSGFGCEGLHASLGAAGALLEYARLTQGTSITHVTALGIEQRQRVPSHGRRDAPKSRNFRNDTRRRCTHVAIAARYVLDQYGKPIAPSLAASSPADRAAIQNRLEGVSWLMGEAGSGPYLAVRACLKRVGDIERITARIALESARPRDLSGLRDSLKQLPHVLAVSPR